MVVKPCGLEMRISMTVVISGVDFNQEDNKKAASINYKNNTKEAKAVNEKTFAGAVVSKGDERKSAKDVTYKSLLSEADDVKQQIMQSATNAKDNLKALCKKLSGAEAVRIDEDGFNLTSADTEECVNIIEKIRIELAMHCEDYTPMGTAIDSEKIKSVTKSAGLANEVADRMEKTMPEAASALETAEKLMPMSESVKNYMVDNKIPATIDGIYQAEYAMNTTGKTAISENVENLYESLKSQIEDIIKDAKLPVDSQNVDNAKGFLAEEIPVTKENLLYKAQLDAINLEDMSSDEKQADILQKIYDNMIIGGEAKDTWLTQGTSIIKQVADVIDVLNKSDITTIEDIVKNQSPEDNTFSVQQLKDVKQMDKGEGWNNSQESETQSSEQVNIKVQSFYTALMETRILMTAQAGVFLAKQGTNLYTASVYELAEQLKDYEQTNTQVMAVRSAIYQVEQAPEDVIGKVLAKLTDGRGISVGLTVAAFAETGNSLKQQYDHAGKTYEAVGTQVRKDLGDSIVKAVDNSTDNILMDLNMENNEKNRAAVRILAANEMEMTEENIQQIKEIHETLNNLIKNMKPETALSMIRENVNPLNDDIAKVNEYLLQKNEDTADDISEKYSRFLYKLDKTDGITTEERCQFIGIYKMMNIFTKDAGKAIGALVKQGADITMKNLMTAYESRRAYGLDVGVDDNSGIAAGSESFYRNLFANTGSKVTPATLVSAKAQQPIEQMSVEGFCETVAENYNPDTEAEAIEGYIEAMKKSIETDAAVIRQIESSQQTLSVNNIQAAEQLLSVGVFPKINGKRVSDGIEKIGQEEELRKMYEDMSQESEEVLQQVLASTDDQNFEDIEEARRSNNTIGYIKNLAVRHDYYVPIDEGEQTGMIHLTLVQDDESQGRISVEMKQEDIGNISLEAKIQGSKTDIFVMQNNDTLTSDTKEALDERLGIMDAMFRNIFNMEDVNINQAGTDRMPQRLYQGADEKTATGELYKMAQVMVKVLAGRY